MNRNLSLLYSLSLIKISVVLPLFILKISAEVQSHISLVRYLYSNDIGEHDLNQLSEMFLVKTTSTISRCSRHFSSAANNPVVGFIGKILTEQDHRYDHRAHTAGLGNMGRGMAANLVKKGHSVLVYDVTPEAVTDLGTEDVIVIF